MASGINNALLREARRHGVLNELDVCQSHASDTLKRLIRLLTSNELGPPAVLIDEYDYPIMESLAADDGSSPTLYQARTRSLARIFGTLKMCILDDLVHSVFATGIT